jgi:hypothetical protein
VVTRALVVLHPGGRVLQQALEWLQGLLPPAEEKGLALMEFHLLGRRKPLTRRADAATSPRCAGRGEIRYLAPRSGEWSARLRAG